MTATDGVTRTRDVVDDIIGQWARVRPKLDVSAMEVFGRLHRSFLLYRLGIAEGFAEAGTNEPGFDVLAALRRAGPEHRLSAGELARRTLVTTGGLTLRVRRLEREGYVRRERDPEDNRMVYVELTDSGRELVDRVADAHFENMNRMLGKLTSDERTSLAHLLGRLYESLQETAPGLGPGIDENGEP
ncbi:MarR family winged helix-turn-helix transcriptional regulator [Geodermatophilus sabuli]|uniref:Transcriptional regulator, MarR family n=1 Tax=Geodermatophilus sabuli TaxID=1564158 RepID=A0A285EAH1_9ACTN|nr:MarR family transcriptional regulator [Geodermatophilus sabuli]MBB3085504.1 DNA-binding MarR family transcriptional regulator [Geodermatophilus sabuli]SNX96072.1 transcriptional regulator, MarR family [Geodermatophilus sabuli]